MSGAGNRYVVVPTVTVLAVIKNRLGGAKKGHQLLKKKADALNMRFRQILRRILETKEKMGVSLRESNFALTEAKYTAGDSVKHTIVDSVKVSSRVFPITPPAPSELSGTPTTALPFVSVEESECPNALPSNSLMILILGYLLCVCFVWSRRLACG